MAFEGSYGGIDDFNFLQSLPHTGSAYQPFYDDVPVNPFEATQHLLANSLAGPSANAENLRRSPTFCDECGFTLESTNEACAFCENINYEVSGCAEDEPGPQADLPQDYQNQHDDNIGQVPSALHSELPDDWNLLACPPHDLSRAPATSDFDESSMFQSPFADFESFFQGQQLWDQMPPDNELLAVVPEDEAQHHEDLLENQAPLLFERVLDRDLNEANVRRHRRRRLRSTERLEVARKRGKVCENCRRMKRKVR
jgi:hypothetical protein